MKARLLKDPAGDIKLLCLNGSISNCSTSVLSNFLQNFKDVKHFNGSDGDWTSYRDMSLYPGETLAYIADDVTLVIHDFSVFEPLLNETYKLSSYIPINEYAKKVNKSTEIVKVLCRAGRIVGAQKKADRWFVPKDAPYPIPPERQKLSGRRKKEKD